MCKSAIFGYHCESDLKSLKLAKYDYVVKEGGEDFEGDYPEFDQNPEVNL